MSQSKMSTSLFTFLYLLVFFGTGCASSTCQYGLFNRPQTHRISGDSYQLTFGGEHPRLDQAERWVHYPAEKLKQWFSDDEPPVDPEEMRTLAICKAQEYLVLNGLTDVNIDVREYDPTTQWKRLRNNDSMHPFWKYTSGSMSHLTYNCYRDVFFVPIALTRLQKHFRSIHQIHRWRRTGQPRQRSSTIINTQVHIL